LEPSVAVLNIPYASTHFAERVDSTPLNLLQPASTRADTQVNTLAFKNQIAHSFHAFLQRKGFAAYLANNCKFHRESFFDWLKAAADKFNLGAVHALGKCHGLNGESSVRDRSVIMYTAIPSRP
jgi:hypothetical protein